MKPAHIRFKQAIKAGYSVEWIQPTPIAQACAFLCGRSIQAVPHFVKSH